MPARSTSGPPIIDATLRNVPSPPTLITALHALTCCVLISSKYARITSGYKKECKHVHTINSSNYERLQVVLKSCFQGSLHAEQCSKGDQRDESSEKGNEMMQGPPTFASIPDEYDGYRGFYRCQRPSVAKIESKTQWPRAWRHL